MFAKTLTQELFITQCMCTLCRVCVFLKLEWLNYNSYESITFKSITFCALTGASTLEELYTYKRKGCFVVGPKIVNIKKKKKVLPTQKKKQKNLLTPKLLQVLLSPLYPVCACFQEL